MRILTLSNLYPPDAYGGYELSCRDVMDRFAAAGHAVTVLTSAAPAATPVADEDWQRGVRRELRLYWNDHVLLSPSLRDRLAVERHNQRALAAAIEAARPDVVSVWNMGAMSLGLLTAVAEQRIPMVLVVCDDWLVYGPRLDAWFRIFDGRPRLARVIEAVTGVPTHLPDLGQVATACFVSDFVRRRAEAESRWSFADGTVVYSGIEREEFVPRRSPADPSGEASPGRWGWKLLYVGRLDPRKGLDTLVDALVDLPPETSLEIIGRGEAAYEEALRRRIADKDLEGRVTVTAVERRELATRYLNADAVVFPSEWDEPFGLVPVEAMACETPVVATGTGGSAEFLVDGGNCLLFTPGDPRDLARAVRRLGDDPALRRTLADGGRRTADVLDTDRLAEVLGRWHAATADQFAHGRPSDRPSIDARPR